MGFVCVMSFALGIPMCTQGGVFVFQLASYSPVKYGDYEYPYWAQMVGIGLSCASMVWVPLYAAYYLLTQKGSFAERVKAGLTPIVKNSDQVKENNIANSINSLDTVVTEAEDNL